MPVVSAADLLAGPRGRRLCLQVALAADEGLWPIVFDASRAFLPTDGSVAIIRLGDDAEAPWPEPASPADVAARIGLVDDARLGTVIASEAALLACLTVTVDAARYWHDPDAVDQLAAVPVVREALAPIAHRLTETGVVDRWSAPMAAEQWRVEFETIVSDAAWPGAVSTTLARWRRQAARMEVLHAGVHVEPGVRVTGIWWSRPLELPSTTGEWGTTPVGLPLVEDGSGWELALVTPARGAGRVLELDEASWADLCRRHPLEVTASSGADWGRVTGRVGRWVIPDWAAVAEEWDAVHLPIAQYLALAGCTIDVGGGTASLIAGWDPDRTVWLTGSVRAWGDSQQWAADEGNRWSVAPAV